MLSVPAESMYDYQHTWSSVSESGRTILRVGFDLARDLLSDDDFWEVLHQRHAREDTHYLLHIYDLMRVSLLCSSSGSEYSGSSLLEVYQRSYDICMQLYEKDVMIDSSFLYIYGLH